MKDSLASRLSRLASDAESLAETIRFGADVPPDRTRRRAHQLRETLGMALILSVVPPRETGNGPMVEMKRRPDGTGEARLAVDLDEAGLTP